MATYKIKNVRVAQSSPIQQTMPKDIVEEVEIDLEVPRKESVGFDQVPLPPKTKEVKVYQYPYKLGDNGCDTDIVPRDGGGDGLGGEKVSFEPEKGEGQTSGNPDTYVQTLNDVPAPTPAGSKDNHAIANTDAMTKIAELESKLKEADRKIQKSEIARERERVARKIAQAEIERGLYSCASDEDFEKRVSEYLDTPTSSLLRELQRVRTYPSVTATSVANLTTTASVNKKTGFIDYGGLALQSGIATMNRQASYTPVLGNDSVQELTNVIQSHMKMGKDYPKEQQ